MGKFHFFFFLAVFVLGFSGCGVTKAYEAAKTAESIPLYEEFLTRYPKSKLGAQAKQELDVLYEERDWQATSYVNTIYAYESFILDYPQSGYKRIAESRIAELVESSAWQEATKVHSVESYEIFISAYPYSKYVGNARARIAEIMDNNAWKEAEYRNTVDSYQGYVSAFPQGVYVEVAYIRITEIRVILPHWEKAVESNSPESYRLFLTSYSSSSYGILAREKLTELEMMYWEEAVMRHTIKYYERYMNHFPEGIYIHGAMKAVIDIEVDVVFKGDYGKLPPMSKIAEDRYLTSNEIELFNNTKYTLTVLYSGSQESKKVVLLPKQKGSISLVNGEYRVAASVDANDVRNYAGSEKLEGGSYSSQFYIETRMY